MKEMRKRGREMDFSNYARDDSVNASTIKDFMDAICKFSREDEAAFKNGFYCVVEKYWDKNKKFEVNAQTRNNYKMGKIIHSMTLESLDYETAIKSLEEYSTDDAMLVERLLRESMSFNKALREIGFLNIKDEFTIERCVESWLKLGLNIQDRQVEKVFFSEYNKMPLKGKIDLVGFLNDKPVVIDLKTVSSVASVEKNIKKYHYWFQCMYYQLLLGEEIEDLILVFLSKSEDEAAVIKFSELDKGSQEAEKSRFNEIIEKFYKYYEWKNYGQC